MICLCCSMEWEHHSHLLCVAAWSGSITRLLCVAAWSGSITIICFVLQHGVGGSLSFALCCSMEWEHHSLALCCSMELEHHYHLLCVATWSGDITLICFLFQHGVRVSLSFALCHNMEWEHCYKMLCVFKMEWEHGYEMLYVSTWS